MNHWQPSATLENLRQRGALFSYIRDFFQQRKVLEVDTAVLSACAVSDPFIDSMEVCYSPNKILYLQSSPEYAMKRLLATGIGSIYQMGKVFRNAEYGRKHNPEFTLLEWYRPNFDINSLIDEITDLISPILDLTKVEKITYSDLFKQYLGFRPETTEIAILKDITRSKFEVNIEDDDPDTWLNLLMSNVIEPELANAEAVFVTEYPASQAALAQIYKGATGYPVAARFELFVRGVELANGYQELTDWQEQKNRLEADQRKRAELDLPQRPLDLRLVAALQHGIPDCAGVALGVDRLLMLALKANSLAEVLPFDLSRA